MSTELAKFNELKMDVSALVAPTLTLKVSDFPSSAVAIDAVKQVKDLINQVDKKRRELVDPLNGKVKEINAYAKGIEAPLLEAEKHIKSQLIAFEVQQEQVRLAAFKKAEEERKRLEAELAAKQEAERAAAPPVEADEWFGAGDEAAEAQKALEDKQADEKFAFDQAAGDKAWAIQQSRIKNTKKIWKCEAVDLAQVPKEFLIVTLNEKAILAAARAGVTTVPGVRLWQETTMAIGANTYVPREALEKVE